MRRFSNNDTVAKSKKSAKPPPPREPEVSHLVHHTALFVKPDKPVAHLAISKQPEFLDDEPEFEIEIDSPQVVVLPTTREPTPTTKKKSE